MRTLEMQVVLGGQAFFVQVFDITSPDQDAPEDDPQADGEEEAPETDPETSRGHSLHSFFCTNEEILEEAPILPSASSSSTEEVKEEEEFEDMEVEEVD